MIPKFVASISARQQHRPCQGSKAKMPHAIIRAQPHRGRLRLRRGKYGRRHEVDFGDVPIRVEIHASDETVEIFVEADFETHAEGRQCFALFNIPRHLFSEASGKAARLSVRRRLGF
jgi:hypothetical protein